MNFSDSINVSVGICAYNEAGNIAQLLESILMQVTESAYIEEIIVVSDGSTDKTDEIVKQAASRAKITFLRNERRSGKYAAINKFLMAAKSPVLVLSSADIILKKDAIENLCLPFINEQKVGMTGARPIPLNHKNSFMGYVVNLQWRLHHELSLIKPKFGELVAFRNIIRELPPTLVDEEHICLCVKERGYDLKYVPEAVIFNKGPDNAGDFLKQRRRIYAGHLLLKKNYNYEVVTLSGIGIFMLLLKKPFRGFKKNIIRFLGAIFLEAAARLLAVFDLIFKKYHYTWKIAVSTKNLSN